ncbi:hypothetical protein [Segatella salivae]|uniref:Uncharacterized protein n=1 Tax=Segatella salivae F0493 TaxID=1395125 RepID=U2MQ70_9BACT|nr:hypothetical protein [Segatella salivae]ERK01419.1 hypothetical protein HMPREF9145_2744 [Segatella salivae F0493]
MNLSTKINVVTVIDTESMIVYQQVYLNNYDAAHYDFKRQCELHKFDITNGWTAYLKEF